MILPPFQQRDYVVVRVSPGLVEACARPTDHRGTSALQFLARKSEMDQLVYPSEKLDDLFDMKSRVLECILSSDPPGGNTFDMPHRCAAEK